MAAVEKLLVKDRVSLRAKMSRPEELKKKGMTIEEIREKVGCARLRPLDLG